ncbi:uncharacterized protein OCT59_018945 [Rhizophagus irregularis]|uniref:F-box domain-containing protein n=3 Tax=Rhizophagus irregularis TaxID=588596 RepID=A0A015LN66_RHIIW|nr:hypothetical protein GLOIN_2v1877795 [Rhizophagus irregularis DAOM 181602=DAOM 197198]EXX56213.1 hypothetical protein RirG_218230 [Rhizophagus irregularis DAOM 197198w]PKY22032.1 hypothetical protein RhiirB3_525473 [Rhizophagus irregularis]POG69126.1 hypothetical protein GLOIN_2v1877795 [Rhizophagus irregularis DAOM 181602=DAOM 197198]UZO26731.1 hypothetical protein OCT59_018945 [Rhizophagus irregularis]GBC34198.1 hypothetical protein GLOIN_2v1877795 [Rhizophagus irregularis DAOM 181602=DAO|eukprot:XP_025175992.1 hypothetical protein GLOIN_2v1877795 [Rhizophagus irregularis DAOM 181602=DAOM 197198]
MSCSKIFSGDLPELTYEIIKYFQNDISTLHSCILVNRLWCRLAIPLLWKDPFSFRTGNCNFIEIYFDNLNDDLKSKLSEYKINDNSLIPSNTLFNYAKFLKYLNIFDIISCVEMWFEVAVRTSKPGNRYFLKDLSSYSVSNFKKLINISLFKIFIENEINLHTLEIEISSTYYYTYFNNILEIILQNTNFIHNIKNLNLYINSPFNFSYANSNSEYKLIKNRISQIINLHQNIKKILLYYDNFPLYQSLLLSKDSNCSNTLNTIIFYCIDFKGITNLDKIFKQLNVLESIHIIYCYSLKSGFDQFINLTKPFKLKSLIINELSHVDKSLQLLLQKSGNYLENFGYILGDLSQQRQLLELITKYCKNIKYLDFYEFESQIIYQIFNLSNLIEHIKQNLNYLSINIWEDYYLSNGNIERSSILLQNLGQTLPSKLEYLSLILSIKENDFRIFLENSQNTFINKLKIMQNNSDDIVQCIKGFIINKKRVNYLAIRNFKGGDLSCLKDEVKEFNLHNIRVLNFNDLSLAFDVYNLVRKIDYL